MFISSIILLFNDTLVTDRVVKERNFCQMSLKQFYIKHLPLYLAEYNYVCANICMYACILQVQRNRFRFPEHSVILDVCEGKSIL